MAIDAQDRNLAVEISVAIDAQGRNLAVHGYFCGHRRAGQESLWDKLASV